MEPQDVKTHRSPLQRCLKGLASFHSFFLEVWFILFPLGQRVLGSLSSLPCALSRQSPLTPQSLCWALGGRDKERFPASRLGWPRGGPMAIGSRRPVASPVPGGLVMAAAGAVELAPRTKAEPRKWPQQRESAARPVGL